MHACKKHSMFIKINVKHSLPVSWAARELVVSVVIVIILIGICGAEQQNVMHNLYTKHKK